MPDAIKNNEYRPCIDSTERNNVTYGALLDSCCISAEYADESDEIKAVSGCETKYTCRLPELCKRCCDDDKSYYHDRMPTCNLPEQRKKWTHRCYRCRDCVEVSNEIQANQTYCSAQRNEKRLCFIYKNETLLLRGCFSHNSSIYNTKLKICQQDSQNCALCEGDLCNHRNYKFYCYQCDQKNLNCRTQPGALQLTECKYNNTLDINYPRGCYTIDK